MVDGGAEGSRNPDDRLSDSRKQFVVSLGERMQVLSAALETLAAAPTDALARGSFQRRVHALGTACSALGFAEAQGAIGRIESLLTELTEEDSEGRLLQIARLLDMVPAMVLGGDAPLSAPPPAPEDGAVPISAVFYGLESLASGFGAKGVSWEVRLVHNPEGVLLAMREAVPDVLIVDAAMPSANSVVEQVLHEGAYDSLRVVVVGAFERPEAAATFLHAGVHRVLPKPLSPASLERHVRELCQQTTRSLAIAPLGEMTLDQLVERIHQEVRRGLLECARPGAREASVPFGEGVEELAAIWGAVARMRELIGLRSAGSVSFDSAGPEGAIALAPWAAGERYASAVSPRAEGSVSLAGRRVIVTDDDPAVVWFIGGVLREAGAEVTEAPDGQAALDLAYQLWPDLIVSDLLMPRLDGFELCRRIKRDLVLSDVPVVVLSWKEDLLQRVRELGAGADGYLQKEANGSVITRNLREVLYARSRIEERFRKSPEVRGRLDTIAPRLIIELASKLLGNASINVRDSAYLYELELRSGRVVLISRTDAEGRSEQGVDLIGPLLGVRVGRFAVRRNSKAVASIMDAAFADLASAAVAKARVAQGLLSPPTLFEVGRLSLQEERVAPYLMLSPVKMRAAAADLNSGMAPSEVAANHGERTLESLLHDLVLHDGILEIYDQQGNALLSPAVARAPASSPPNKKSSPAIPAASASGYGVPASRPPSVGLAAMARSAPSPAPPVASASATAASGSATPAAGTPALAAETAQLSGSPSAPAGEIRKPSSSHVIGRIKVGPPPLPRPTGRLTVATEMSGPAATPTASGVPNSPSLPARPPRPQSFSPVPIPQLKPEMVKPKEPRDSAPELELGEALVEQLLDSEAEPISEDYIEPLSEKSAAVNVEAPKIELSAPAIPASVPALAPALSEAIELRTVKSPPPGPVLQPEPSPVDAIVQSLTASDESRPGRTALARRSLTPPVMEQVDDAASQSVLVPGQRGAFNTSDDPSPPTEQQPQAGSAQSPAVSMLLDPKWLGESDVRAPVELKPSPELNSLISGESKAQVKAGPPAPPPQSSASRGGYVLLAVVAAGLAFTVMRALAPTDEDSTPPRPAAPERAQSALEPPQSQRAASGVAATKTAQTAVTLVQSDHELPVEITLAPGKGLLEVSTSGKHRIYVDGVFVGPGPLRRVPLSPGTHDIRVSLDGIDVSAPAQIREGRRTLLQRSGGAPE